jgi:hypothetical protein
LRLRNRYEVAAAVFDLRLSQRLRNLEPENSNAIEKKLSLPDQRLGIELGAAALEGLLHGGGELTKGPQLGKGLRLLRRPVLFAPAPLPLSAGQDVLGIEATAPPCANELQENKTSRGHARNLALRFRDGQIAPAKMILPRRSARDPNRNFDHAPLP